MTRNIPIYIPGAFLVAMLIIGCEQAALETLVADTGTTISKMESTSVHLLNSTIDLGTQEAEKRVESEFTIVNDADAAITIDGIRGSCSCLAGGKFPIEVGPRTSQSVPFYLNTSGKRGGAFGGRLAVLYTLDGVSKESQLMVKANIQLTQLLKADPPVAFCEVGSDNTGTASVKISMFGVEFQGWEDVLITSPDWLSVELGGLDLNEETFRIDAKPDVANLTGVKFGRIVLQSRTRRFRKLTIPFTAKYSGTLTSTPRTIVCTDNEAKEIRIRSPLMEKSSIESVSAHVLGVPTDFVKLTVLESSSDWVTVEMRPMATFAKPTRANVRVQLECRGEQHHIEVPVLFFIGS